MAYEDGYWFRANRYGWGWGVSVKWQGWLILRCFLSYCRPPLGPESWKGGEGFGNVSRCPRRAPRLLYADPELAPTLAIVCSTGSVESRDDLGDLAQGSL
jgi:hypothetical protein